MTRRPPDTITDSDGLVWALFCDCPLHPLAAHNAEPIDYVGHDEPINQIPIVRDALKMLAAKRRTAS